MSTFGESRQNRFAMRRNFLLFLTVGWLGGAALPGQAQRPASAPLAGDGLRGEYFNGPNFEQKAYTRTDPQVAFDWNWSYPAPGVQREYFSVRWTGKLYAPLTGRYRFSAVVDDGVRVWVGGKRVIDEWRKQDDIRFVGEIFLTARNWYDLRVEYYNDWKGSIVFVNWELPPTDPAARRSPIHRPELIPTEYLYTPARFAARHPTATPKVTPAPPRTASVNAPQPRMATRQNPTAPVSSAPLPPSTRAKDTAATAKPSATVRNLSAGQTLTLRNVVFAQGSPEILPQSFPELDELAASLKTNSSLRLEIIGHTDTVGDRAMNQRLSEQRARAVVLYLARRGVAESRMESKGFGGTRPLVGGTTESERSKNRRVEIRVK